MKYRTTQKSTNMNEEDRLIAEGQYIQAIALRLRKKNVSLTFARKHTTSNPPQRRTIQTLQRTESNIGNKCKKPRNKDDNSNKTTNEEPRTKAIHIDKTTNEEPSTKGNQVDKTTIKEQRTKGIHIDKTTNEPQRTKDIHSDKTLHEEPSNNGVFNSNKTNTEDVSIVFVSRKKEGGNRLIDSIVIDSDDSEDTLSTDCEDDEDDDEDVTNTRTLNLNRDMTNERIRNVFNVRNKYVVEIVSTAGTEDSISIDSDDEDEDERVNNIQTVNRDENKELSSIVLNSRKKELGVRNSNKITKDQVRIVSVGRKDNISIDSDDNEDEEVTSKHKQYSETSLNHIEVTKKPRVPINETDEWFKTGGEYQHSGRHYQQNRSNQNEKETNHQNLYEKETSNQGQYHETTVNHIEARVSKEEYGKYCTRGDEYQHQAPHPEQYYRQNTSIQNNAQKEPIIFEQRNLDGTNRQSDTQFNTIEHQQRTELDYSSNYQEQPSRAQTRMFEKKDFTNRYVPYNEKYKPIHYFSNYGSYPSYFSRQRQNMFQQSRTVDRNYSDEQCRRYYDRYYGSRNNINEQMKELDGIQNSQMLHNDFRPNGKLREERCPSIDSSSSDDASRQMIQNDLRPNGKLRKERCPSIDSSSSDDASRQMIQNDLRPNVKLRKERCPSIDSSSSDDASRQMIHDDLSPNVKLREERCPSIDSSSSDDSSSEEKQRRREEKKKRQEEKNLRQEKTLKRLYILAYGEREGDFENTAKKPKLVGHPEAIVTNNVRNKVNVDFTLTEKCDRFENSTIDYKEICGINEMNTNKRIHRPAITKGNGEATKSGEGEEKTNMSVNDGMNDDGEQPQGSTLDKEIYMCDHIDNLKQALDTMAVNETTENETNKLKITVQENENIKNNELIIYNDEDVNNRTKSPVEENRESTHDIIETAQTCIEDDNSSLNSLILDDDAYQNVLDSVKGEIEDIGIDDIENDQNNSVQPFLKQSNRNNTEQSLANFIKNIRNELAIKRYVETKSNHTNIKEPKGNTSNNVSETKYCVRQEITVSKFETMKIVRDSANQINQVKTSRIVTEQTRVHVWKVETSGEDYVSTENHCWTKYQNSFYQDITQDTVNNTTWADEENRDHVNCIVKENVEYNYPHEMPENKNNCNEMDDNNNIEKCEGTFCSKNRQDEIQTAILDNLEIHTNEDSESKHDVPTIILCKSIQRYLERRYEGEPQENSNINDDTFNNAILKSTLKNQTEYRLPVNNSLVTKPETTHLESQSFNFMPNIVSLPRTIGKPVTIQSNTQERRKLRPKTDKQCTQLHIKDGISQRSTNKPRILVSIPITKIVKSLGTHLCKSKSLTMDKKKSNILRKIYVKSRTPQTKSDKQDKTMCSFEKKIKKVPLKPVIAPRKKNSNLNSKKPKAISKLTAKNTEKAKREKKKQYANKTGRPTRVKQIDRIVENNNVNRRKSYRLMEKKYQISLNPVVDLSNSNLNNNKPKINQVNSKLNANNTEKSTKGKKLERIVENIHARKRKSVRNELDKDEPTTKEHGNVIETRNNFEGFSPENSKNSTMGLSNDANNMYGTYSPRRDLLFSPRNDVLLSPRNESFDDTYKSLFKLFTYQVSAEDIRHSVTQFRTVNPEGENTNEEKCQPGLSKTHEQVKEKPTAHDKIIINSSPIVEYKTSNHPENNDAPTFKMTDQDTTNKTIEENMDQFSRSVNQTNVVVENINANTKKGRKRKESLSKVLIEDKDSAGKGKFETNNTTHNVTADTNQMSQSFRPSNVPVDNAKELSNDTNNDIGEHKELAKEHGKVNENSIGNVIKQLKNTHSKRTRNDVAENIAKYDETTPTQSNPITYEKTVDQISQSFGKENGNWNEPDEDQASDLRTTKNRQNLNESKGGETNDCQKQTENATIRATPFLNSVPLGKTYNGKMSERPDGLSSQGQVLESDVAQFNTSKGTVHSSPDSFNKDFTTQWTNHVKSQTNTLLIINEKLRSEAYSKSQIPQNKAFSTVQKPQNIAYWVPQKPEDKANWVAERPQSEVIWDEKRHQSQREQKPNTVVKRTRDIDPPLGKTKPLVSTSLTTTPQKQMYTGPPFLKFSQPKHAPVPIWKHASPPPRRKTNPFAQNLDDNIETGPDNIENGQNLTPSSSFTQNLADKIQKGSNNIEDGANSTASGFSTQNLNEKIQKCADNIKNGQISTTNSFFTQNSSDKIPTSPNKIQDQNSKTTRCSAQNPHDKIQKGPDNTGEVGQNSANSNSFTLNRIDKRHTRSPNSIEISQNSLTNSSLTQNLGEKIQIEDHNGLENGETSTGSNLVCKVCNSPDCIIQKNRLLATQNRRRRILNGPSPLDPQHFPIFNQTLSAPENLRFNNGPSPLSALENHRLNNEPSPLSVLENPQLNNGPSPLSALENHQFNNGPSPLSAPENLRFNNGPSPLSALDNPRFNNGPSPLSAPENLRFNNGPSPLPLLDNPQLNNGPSPLPLLDNPQLNNGPSPLSVLENPRFNNNRPSLVRNRRNFNQTPSFPSSPRIFNRPPQYYGIQNPHFFNRPPHYYGVHNPHNFNRPMNQELVNRSIDVFRNMASNLDLSRRLDHRFSNMGPNLNNMGPNLNNMGPNLSHMGPNLNNMGPNLSNMGANLNNIGPSPNNMGPNLNNMGPILSNMGFNLGKMGPNLNNMGPNTNNVGPNVSNMGPNLSNMGPNLSNIGPNLSNFGPNLGRMGPNLSNVGPNPNNMGPNLGSMEPNPNNVGPNLGSLGPNLSNIGTNPNNMVAYLTKMGPDVNNMGPNLGSIGHNLGNMGPNLSNMGPNVKNMGPNLGSIGPNPNSIEHNLGNTGPNLINIGLNLSNMGPNLNNMGPNLNNMGPNLNNMGSNVNNMGPNLGSIGPNPNSIGHNLGNTGPTLSNTVPNLNNMGPNLRNMGSNPNNIGPNQVVSNETIQEPLNWRLDNRYHEQVHYQPGLQGQLPLQPSHLGEQRRRYDQAFQNIQLGFSNMPIPPSKVPISPSNVSIGRSKVPIAPSNMPITRSSNGSISPSNVTIGRSNVPIDSSMMSIDLTSMSNGAAPNGSTSLSKVPIGLSNVSIGGRSNVPIDSSMMPINLTSMSNGAAPNGPTSPSKVPIGLSTMSIGGRSNVPIDSSMMSIDLTSMSNGAPPNGSTSPSKVPIGLSNVSIGGRSNVPIDSSMMPINLTSMSNGAAPNGPTSPSKVPIGLSNMSIGGRSNVPIDSSMMSIDLTSMSNGAPPNGSTSPSKVPIGLSNMSIGGRSNVPIDSSMMSIDLTSMSNGAPPNGSTSPTKVPIGPSNMSIGGRSNIPIDSSIMSIDLTSMSNGSSFNIHGMKYYYLKREQNEELTPQTSLNQETISFQQQTSLNQETISFQRNQVAQQTSLNQETISFQPNQVAQQTFLIQATIFFQRNQATFIANKHSTLITTEQASNRSARTSMAESDCTENRHGLPQALRQGVPQTPRHGVPKTLRHGVPQTPRYGVPQILRHGVPQTPRHGVPQTPRHGVPQTPKHGVPQTPRHGVLQTPRHGIPQTPRHGVPQTPRHGVPQTPKHGVPQTPRHGVPQTPRHGVPQTPRHGVPQTPRHGVPQTPRQGVPQTLNNTTILSNEQTESIKCIPSNTETQGILKQGIEQRDSSQSHHATNLPHFNDTFRGPKISYPNLGNHTKEAVGNPTPWPLNVPKEPIRLNEKHPNEVLVQFNEKNQTVLAHHNLPKTCQTKFAKPVEINNQNVHDLLYKQLRTFRRAKRTVSLAIDIARDTPPLSDIARDIPPLSRNEEDQEVPHTKENVLSYNSNPTKDTKHGLNNSLQFTDERTQPLKNFPNTTSSTINNNPTYPEIKPFDPKMPNFYVEIG